MATRACSGGCAPGRLTPSLPLERRPVVLHALYAQAKPLDPTRLGGAAVSVQAGRQTMKFDAQASGDQSNALAVSARQPPYRCFSRPSSPWQKLDFPSSPGSSLTPPEYQPLQVRQHRRADGLQRPDAVHARRQDPAAKPRLASG